MATRRQVAEQLRDEAERLEKLPEDWPSRLEPPRAALAEATAILRDAADGLTVVREKARV